MAITSVGIQGTVGESEGARRWWRAGVPFMCPTQRDFQVRHLTGQQRTVEVAPGTALICGVLVTETTARTVNFEANTGTTTRYDLVVLRLEWLGLGQSRAVLEVKKGTTSPPAPTRTPGTVYEAVLAVVQIAPNTGQLSGAMVYQLTPWGGKGGPVYVAQSSYISYLDIEEGTEVVTVNNGYRQRKSVGGTFEVVEAEVQPWSTWNLNLRSAETGQAVILGTGGVQKGRYKVIRNMCFAEVEIRRGVAGSDFRYGDLIFDLPPGQAPTFPSSGTQGLQNQWMLGHLYSIGDGYMDWRAQVTVLSGFTTAGIWTPTSAVDVRMRPWRSANASVNPSTGVPYQGNNKYTEGEVFTAVLRYAVRVD